MTDHKNHKIKPSQIPQSGPKLQKYLYAKYMAYTVTIMCSFHWFERNVVIDVNMEESISMENSQYCLRTYAPSGIHTHYPLCFITLNSNQITSALLVMTIWAYNMGINQISKWLCHELPGAHC